MAAMFKSITKPFAAAYRQLKWGLSAVSVALSAYFVYVLEVHAWLGEQALQIARHALDSTFEILR